MKKLIPIIFLLSCGAPKHAYRPSDISDVHPQARITANFIAALSDFAQPQPTLYGIYYTAKNQLSVADSLGVSLLRMPVNSTLNAAFKAGKTTEINISDTAKSFTTDSLRYATMFAGKLEQIKEQKYYVDSLIKYLACENEPLNETLHSNPRNYIPLLRNAAFLAHASGFKIIDGGLTKNEIENALAVYYAHRGLQDSLQWFLKATGIKLSNTQVLQAADVEYFFAQYKTIGIDAVNIHWYDNATFNPAILQTCVAYVRKRTGISNIVTNECGQKDNAPTTVTNMLQAFKDAGFNMVIWTAYDGKNCIGLVNSDGTVRSNGMAFKNFVNQ